MKAKVSDSIQTIVDCNSDFDDRIIAKGTVGAVVKCYRDPEGYAVDLAIPNSELIGGFCYENVILAPEQFIVISSQSQSNYDDDKIMLK